MHQGLQVTLFLFKMFVTMRYVLPDIRAAHPFAFPCKSSRRKFNLNEVSISLECTVFKRSPERFPFPDPPIDFRNRIWIKFHFMDIQQCGGIISSRFVEIFLEVCHNFFGPSRSLRAVSILAFTLDMISDMDGVSFSRLSAALPYFSRAISILFASISKTTLAPNTPSKGSDVGVHYHYGSLHVEEVCSFLQNSRQAISISDEKPLQCC